MNNRRLYVYTVVVDAGGAPCVVDELLSLAICKPAIRRTAEKDDLIFDFGSNIESQANRLIYVAKVNEKISAARYYELNEYEERPDCIYERNQDDHLVLRKAAKYHAEEDARQRDVGAFPAYANANVLVCTEFRYFGGVGTTDWKGNFPNVAMLVESLGQGHRVTHGCSAYEELLALLKSYARNMNPRFSDSRPMPMAN